MLGKAISPTENKVRATELRLLDLSRLLGTDSLEIRAEDGITGVWVERLTLESPDAGALLITLGASLTDLERRSLYERARTAFGSNSPIGKPGWRVIDAVLRVFFAPGRTGPGNKGMPIELKLPNRTNLRSLSDEKRAAFEALLDRWGLYAPSYER